MSLENEEGIVGLVAPAGLPEGFKGAEEVKAKEASEEAAGVVQDESRGSVSAVLGEESFQNPEQLARIVKSVENANLPEDVKVALKGMFRLSFVESILGRAGSFIDCIEGAMKENSVIAASVVNWMLSLDVSSLDRRYQLEFEVLMGCFLNSFAQFPKNQMDPVVKSLIDHEGFLRVWESFMKDARTSSRGIAKYEANFLGVFMGKPKMDRADDMSA